MDPTQLPNEIFDMAFGMLSIEDLLRCERVKKRWCELIRGGLETSKALFRYETSMKEQSSSDGRQAFLQKTWNIHRGDCSTESEVLTDCIAHPLLSRFIDPTKLRSVIPFDDPDLPYISCWHLLRTLNRRNGLPNPDASWRQMFITWPPLKEIELRVSYKLHNGQPDQEGPKVIKISESEGIMLNHFFYALSGSATLNRGRPAGSIMEWAKAIPKIWFRKRYKGMRIRVVPIIRAKENERKTAAEEA
ncbi:uncharacterized protein J4E79_005399 [Alternaria viburni]|uniref:uncharacterized protein n=1 Tax=Alternaria viburni TaxID=566460 RepID=UPI0020C55F35|nr:uncharacterized protein J4E79_005399 [Alternaria viburni]KAI4660831.1 hypothetical protein J4E79_005399 [Alternaria viburni]